MNQKSLDALKAQLLSLYPTDPVPTEQIQRVEQILGVVLPDDLKALAAVYAGGTLGGIDHYDIGNPEREHSIAAKTATFRAFISLPHEFIALAEPPISLILLHTRSDAKEPTPVIWLDSIDVERYLSGAACLGTPPEIFASYANFFHFLLEREEAERAEQ